MDINTATAASVKVETMPLAPPISKAAPDANANPIVAPEKINSQVSDPRSQDAKANEKQASAFSAEEAKQMAAEMNDIMDDLQTSLGFSIREDLHNQVVVEITDRKTKEVIKQIPTEEMLAIKEKMEEFSGLLFDQRV